MLRVVSNVSTDTTRLGKESRSSLSCSYSKSKISRIYLLGAAINRFSIASLSRRIVYAIAVSVSHAVPT